MSRQSPNRLQIRHGLTLPHKGPCRSCPSTGSLHHAGSYLLRVTRSDSCRLHRLCARAGSSMRTILGELLRVTH
jgi:hypothetical protein